MKKRTKAEILTLPTGTAPGGYPVRADFGKEFKNCLGYYAVVLANGGITPEACKLSLTNSAETFVDKVALSHYLVDKTIAIKDRFFKEEPIGIDGYINIQLDTPAPLTAPLSIQFLFIVSE